MEKLRSHHSEIWDYICSVKGSEIEACPFWKDAFTLCSCFSAFYDSYTKVKDEKSFTAWKKEHERWESFLISLIGKKFTEINGVSNVANNEEDNVLGNMRVRNLGQKSIDEVLKKLRERGVDI